MLLLFHLSQLISAGLDVSMQQNQIYFPFSLKKILDFFPSLFLTVSLAEQQHLVSAV